MKKQFFTGIAVFTLTALATLRAGTYTQNFDSATNGTTGSGLNDGSYIVGSGATSYVYASTNWGALAQPWKALFMTPMSPGVTASFFMPNLDPGLATNTSLTSFNIQFTLLINYINRTTQAMGDGFSLNFGQFYNTTSAYGGEYGMYSPTNTGNVFSLSFYTYNGGTPRIEARYNGSTVATAASIIPFYNTSSPAPASAFLPVNISWNELTGLDVAYNGSTVFTNLTISNFTPQAGYSFAMAARTGSAYENVFVDSIQATTVPEPSTYALLALSAAGIGAHVVRRRRR